MRKFIKLSISVLLIIAICIGLTSCSSSTSSVIKNIIFNMYTMPSNIDPQLASTDEELLIVRNTFEGLFRIHNGDVVKGACESYKVSDDGLTYTFTIKDGLKWSDGSQVTADDFRFGLVRALRPETLSPGAQQLFCIENAESVSSGEADESTLGIIAESKLKLTIKLSEQNPDLLKTLTYAFAMPCNEALFEEAAGRYSMTTQLSLFNGPFKISQWTESSIKLAVNKEYAGSFSAVASTVSLTFGNDDATKIDNINSSLCDIALISMQSAELAEDAALDTIVFYDTTWIAVINSDASVIGDPAISAAFKKALGNDSYQDSLPSHFKSTAGIVANDLLVGTSQYRGLCAPIKARKSKSAEAAADLIDALKANKASLPTITIKYADYEGIKHTAAQIAQHWQKELGAVVNIEAASLSDLTYAVSNGYYQIALLPITSSDGSAYSLLNQFGAESSLFSSFNIDIDKHLNGSSASDTSDKAKALKKAEDAILNSSYIIPIAQSGHCYAINSAISNLQFDMYQGGLALYN